MPTLRALSARTLRVLVVLILVAAAALGAMADVWMRGHTPRELRARWLAQAGRFSDAETLLLEEARARPPTVPLVVALLDAHAQRGLETFFGRPREDHDDDDTKLVEGFGHGARVHEGSNVRQHAIVEVLTAPGVSPEVALLGGYWLGARTGALPAALQAEVERVADAAPAMAWSNHLLGRRAHAHGDLVEAARRFEREGVQFGRREDIARMLGLLEDAGEWEMVGQRLSDPDVLRLAPPWSRLRFAVEKRDWRTVFGLAWKASYGDRYGKSSILLATVSALVWLVFCFRLGRATDRPVRIPVYLAALGLGALSIVPTDVLIAVQDGILHLTPSRKGDLARDLLHFVFGVGFREELSKLLLFVPLVPVLRRMQASKIDVLVSGALVGLGFAVIENLGYFARGHLDDAIGRFLTANFMHMSMTGLTAAALWDAIDDPDRYLFDASRTFLFVVVLHGAYDFFIGVPGGAGYLSTVIFVFLARQFTARIDVVRGAMGRGLSLLDIFVLGSACLLGTSFVYASAMVGPAMAAAVLLQGVLGLFIIAYFFVTEASAALSGR